MTTPTSSRKRSTSASARSSARGAGKSTRSQATSKSRTPSSKSRTPSKTAAASKSAQAGKTKAAKSTQRSKTAKAAKSAKPTPQKGDHRITVTIPSLGHVAQATGLDRAASATHLDRVDGGRIGRAAKNAANVALMPIAAARRVLPAKGGLPLYAGLGVLGAAEVIEWPVALGVGVGYAVLRRGGVMAPPSETRKV